MRPTEPLPLYHSWPLYERGLRFDLGHVHDAGTPERDVRLARRVTASCLADSGIGQWSCDLSDNSLTWSPEVYDIFGLPRHGPLARAASVSLYAESSRSAMERLRAYAIKHRRGFTLDAEIHAADGQHRWMRLTAAPVFDGDRVRFLRGLKQDVTGEYRGQV